MARPWDFILPLVTKGGKSVNFFKDIVDVDAEMWAGYVKYGAYFGAGAAFF